MSKFKEFMLKERHIKFPYLDLYINTPLLAIRTELMNEAYERYTYEYIGVYIKLWKWDTRFRLYEPGESRRK